MLRADEQVGERALATQHVDAWVGVEVRVKGEGEGEGDGGGEGEGEGGGEGAGEGDRLPRNTPMPCGLTNASPPVRLPYVPPMSP